jgi:hypothetical protein
VKKTRSSPRHHSRVAPPRRLLDVGEVKEGVRTLLGPVLPQMAAEIASLAGKRTPRISKKAARALGGRVERLLDDARPYLLGLHALAGGVTAAEFKYALLEGLLRKTLNASGCRVPATKDAFQFQMELLERGTAVPSSLKLSKPFATARRSIESFANDVVARVPPAKLEEFLAAWYETKEPRKLMQFVRQWRSFYSQSRRAVPRRVTDKAAMDLGREYALCASFVEQRLRFLVALSREADGVGKPWPDMEKESLNNLLQAAAARPALAVLGDTVDRHVRNALAHNGLEVDVNAGACRFHDQRVTVTWSIDDFFVRTKTLTLTVVALIGLDNVLAAARVRRVVHELWAQTKTKPVPTIMMAR